MKTDVIKIDNTGKGFDDITKQVEKVAVYNDLSHKEQLHLQLLIEEMISLVRNAAGEMKADLWIENEGPHYELHMNAETSMDAEKRRLLVDSSRTQQNESAKTILGKLREIIDELLTPDAKSQFDLSYDVMKDISMGNYKEQEWDGYERSILLKAADDVKVGVRGGTVEVIVIKNFEA